MWLDGTLVVLHALPFWQQPSSLSPLLPPSLQTSTRAFPPSGRSADLKFRVDLNKLHTEHHKFCRYDPDVFPGLTYRMKVPDVVLLIFHRCDIHLFTHGRVAEMIIYDLTMIFSMIFFFSSGNVVLTKSKTREDIKRAFDNIYPVLNMYRSK